MPSFATSTPSTQLSVALHFVQSFTLVQMAKIFVKCHQIRTRAFCIHLHSLCSGANGCTKNQAQAALLTAKISDTQISDPVLFLLKLIGAVPLINRPHSHVPEDIYSH